MFEGGTDVSPDKKSMVAGSFTVEVTYGIQSGTGCYRIGDG